MKLGGRADLPEFIPPRPKGMWHSTYERLRDKSVVAEEEAEELFEARAAVIVERLFQKTGERSFWG